MYGKHSAVKAPASHSRKNSQSKLWMIAVAFLLLTGVSAATIAFLMDTTEPVVNDFKYATVSCEVHEQSFDGKLKSSVTIQNTGEVESYIRAKVVITWMSEDGKTVMATKPQETVDYTIVYSNDPNWQLGSDGYWYYQLPVAIGASTAPLIDSCALIKEDGQPDGFYLSVEIVGSAIQSTPVSAVTDRWKVGVNDKKLVVQ